MKKLVVLTLILFASISLYAGVFELFYPDISYYEMADLVRNKMLGAFSFDKKVEISRDVDIMGKNSYLYYDKGKHDTIYFNQYSSDLLFFTDKKICQGRLLTGEYVSLTLFNIPTFRPEKKGGVIVCENYTVEEQSERKVVFKAKEEDVRIELEEFDGWARKILHSKGRVLYCRWVLNWKEIEGIRIPTTEAFYVPSILGGIGVSQIAFKETVATGGFDNDYGAFTEETFRDLFERLK